MLDMTVGPRLSVITFKCRKSIVFKLLDLISSDVTVNSTSDTGVDEMSATITVMQDRLDTIFACIQKDAWELRMKPHENLISAEMQYKQPKPQPVYIPPGTKVMTVPPKKRVNGRWGGATDALLGAFKDKTTINLNDVAEALVDAGYSATSSRNLISRSLESGVIVAEGNNLYRKSR